VDALAVGLVFVPVEIITALLYFLTISLITFIICFSSVLLGKKFGNLFSNKAQIAGGIILIVIGLKIFIEYLISVL